MAPSADDASRLRAAESLRELATQLDRNDMPAADLDALAAQLAALAARLPHDDYPTRGAWWERGPDYRASFEADSPFRGTLNPWAPSMVVQRRGEPGSDDGAVAEVTLDRRWSGPPKALHGGVLAGLFDEVIGEAAAHAVPDAFAVTGRLSVRYRSRTPLGVPLRLEAEIASRSTRAITVNARCIVADTATATAEALMVVRRRTRHTERQ